ncbi:MAG: alpha/beta fold hydrolase [Planctomycetia bacterium]|nr:alpha/beta fold hydrolase [Planctomycetia bacterium]
MDKHSLDQRRSWVFRLSVLLCYATLVAMAVTWTYSWSGWLVLGIAPVLLLDKLMYRLLAPPLFESRAALLLIRLGYVVIGVVGFTVLAGGAVTWHEALYLGMVLSLVTFLFEYGLEWAWYVLSCLYVGAANDRFHPLRIAGLAAVLALPIVMVHPLLTVHPIRKVAERTPQDQGIDYEEVTATTDDGVRLHGWFVPADRDARGSVVYFHSYGENRGQVLSLLEPLHKLGLNVVAFDFRGHGTSAGHTVTFGHREVNDVAAACAAARQRCPDKPLLLVGVSYGAAVTLQALDRVPDVQGVWVDSTFGRLSTVVERHFAFLPQTLQPAAVKFHNALVWLDVGVWGPDVNPIDALAGVRVPVYFCHGRSDPLTSFSEAKSVFESYAGPKWSYWIDNDREYPHLTPADRREYFRRMNDFLRACLDGTAQARGPLAYEQNAAGAPGRSPPSAATPVMTPAPERKL